MPTAYLGEPAPDISNVSIFGSPFSGTTRASPKSKILTETDVRWNVHMLVITKSKSWEVTLLSPYRHHALLIFCNKRKAHKALEEEHEIHDVQRVVLWYFMLRVVPYRQSQCWLALSHEILKRLTQEIILNKNTHLGNSKRLECNCDSLIECVCKYTMAAEIWIAVSKKWLGKWFQ